MSGNRGIDIRKLKVPVTKLLRKVFTEEKFSIFLDVGVSDEGLYERGEGEGLWIDLNLQSSPDGIRARGKVAGRVRMRCTRCLEEYEQELNIDVDEFFRRPGLDVMEGGRPAREMNMEEDDEYAIEDGIIDMNTLVNDAVMLSLPIKHLCREDCRGLCPVCGKNLNEGECGCERESIDPRLEVLRTLLDRDE